MFLVAFGVHDTNTILYPGQPFSMSCGQACAGPAARRLRNVSARAALWAALLWAAMALGIVPGPGAAPGIAADGAEAAMLRRYMAEALPAVIAELRRRGFELTTVGELIRDGDRPLTAACPPRAGLLTAQGRWTNPGLPRA
jgi:hypothetical protein